MITTVLFAAQHRRAVSLCAPLPRAFAHRRMNVSASTSNKNQ
ncbi:hypothetical protein A7982_12448 [Minicystis rosea]|nr:hypothetical protein A7982_12448 [Minicystis rosea]